jgi:hypothetical protein
VRTDLSGLTGPVVDQVEAVGGQGAQVGGYLVAGPKVTKVSWRMRAWSAMTNASFSAVFPWPR